MKVSSKKFRDFLFVKQMILKIGEDPTYSSHFAFALMQKGLILYDSLFHIFFCTEFALVSASLEMSLQLIFAVETELGTFDADKLPLILLPEK